MKRAHRRVNPQVLGGIGDKLYDRLSERVIGQDAAIRAIVSCYQQRLSGMAPAGQPVGNLLFLGPTGSGKTHLAEQTAEILSGMKDALVVVNCAEFQHSQDIAKLIGAPPGYIGHKDSVPALNQAVLDRSLSKTCRLSFVLFDEIEKASEALWALLLGILSKGKMKTGANEPVDFDRCLIFLTSNLGAEQIDKLSNPPLGIAPGLSAAEIQAKIGVIGAAAARKKFTPEFINRMDDIVVFHPLDRDSLAMILDLELNTIQDRIFDQLGEKGYMFAVSTAARKEILDQGCDARYGARYLKRSLKKNLMDPLSRLVCDSQIKTGDMALLDHEDGKFILYRELEGMSPLQMGWTQNLIYEKGVAVPSMRHFKYMEEPAA